MGRAPCGAVPGRAARGGSKRGVRRRLRAIVRVILPAVLKQIAGAPDYAAYLEHCRRTGHAPRLGEREFVHEFFESRGNRPRCC